MGWLLFFAALVVIGAFGWEFDKLDNRIRKLERLDKIRHPEQWR